MRNKYRLSKDVAQRKEPSKKPKKIIWLSVEGTRTEVNYFSFISKYRDQLGFDMQIDVKPLRKSDTAADPESVLDLMDEFLELRDDTLIQEILGLPELVDDVGEDELRIYLDNKKLLSKEVRTKIKTVFQNARFDVEYRKALQENTNEGDVFAVVIDTEGKNNQSRKGLKSVVAECKRKNYDCFLSNPCFEFFLLLHGSLLKEEYEKHKDEFINNPRISKGHTFVSDLLSQRNNHGKIITEKKFVDLYLPNIDQAIANAQRWPHTLDEVIDKVGTNMVDFFLLFREKE